MTELVEEFDGLRRDAAVRQELHGSRAEGMQFVRCERRRIGERLVNVLGVELRYLSDDLRWGQSIRDEVHDVGNGDSKAANGGTTGQYGGILCNAVEGLSHRCPRHYTGRMRHGTRTLRQVRCRLEFEAHFFPATVFFT